ncbi:MAG: hypothetical protein ACAH95_16270 [Fimbriimonas sp.]
MIGDVRLICVAILAGDLVAFLWLLNADLAPPGRWLAWFFIGGFAIESLATLALTFSKAGRKRLELCLSLLFEGVRDGLFLFRRK